MGLGWTCIVYRLPPELRYADGVSVVEAVRAAHATDHAKVTQWDSGGLAASAPPRGAGGAGVAAVGGVEHAHAV
jgi:hypothetical protein